MRAVTASPFRPTAFQHYTRTRASATQLTGLSARRILVVWLLLALCAAVGLSVLVLLAPLVS
jgi:hypothetical protein